jgi:2-polyprenyl-6-methoxyphenol hydroxylase-like FAD-dependent oxidoreductase
VVRKTLRHCPRDASLYYDQVAQIEMDTWTRGPVTLVGDACQAVSFMAGHGASMALGGAYVLADELRQGGPVEAAALRYQQRLRPLIRDKQAAGRRHGPVVGARYPMAHRRAWHRAVGGRLAGDVRTPAPGFFGDARQRRARPSSACRAAAMRRARPRNDRPG